MSRLMADLCRLLRVKQIRTTVFHPQTDGLVEHFNQTLKQMLKRVAAEDRKDWDLMLPYVLFGIRKVPQASTGFTPFELLFGRQPRRPLDVAREAWEQQQPAPLRSAIEHVREMRERIERVMPLVREHLTKAQQSQQRIYNRAAQPREFQSGDRVTVLVPTSASKFLATWQGPYTVTERVGPVTYRLRQPGRRPSVDPVAIDMGDHLSAAQKTELNHLTNVIQHDIRAPPGVIVRQRPYRVPEAWRQAIENEISEMLNPIVMVPKPDGTLHFCNDFRPLNEVSEFDGCWNVWGGPGSSQPSISQKDIGKEDSLLYPFSTPSGQYQTLPFGLHGAPATFQRMMDIILRPHQSYAAAYLNDVLRYYLLGRRFTLITDHAPLQWMARAKDTNARVTGWFLVLQDFNFMVEHRAGTANSYADGLSRL
ncbi:hypothetical protein M9458_035088, partial [Cirrhinus mrigala]